MKCGSPLGAGARPYAVTGLVAPRNRWNMLAVAPRPPTTNAGVGLGIRPPTMPVVAKPADKTVHENPNSPILLHVVPRAPINQSCNFHSTRLENNSDFFVHLGIVSIYMVALPRSR